MNNNIDIFNLESADELEHTPKYSTNNFISEAKDVLSKFEVAYSSSWTTRWPTDDELEALEKAGCDGAGAYDVEDKEVICVTNEYGEWLIREIDSECLIAEIENVLYEDSSFFELIHCEITDLTPQPHDKNR